MRLFVAINLPAVERSAIRAATRRMRDVARGISWVSEDCLHVTIKFLGEQTDEGADTLSRALSNLAVWHRPLLLELGGLGAFPNLRKPRIIWLAVTPESKLELLHHDVESACGVLGHELDGRPFRPHITLGRVRRPVTDAAARALAGEARAVRYRGVAEAFSLDLMSSGLSKTGPRYGLIASAPLLGASAQLP
ncbi:MAG: RNA 2',3'-cyclic phosphodiesterase [Gemmatimonadaceae bacterium]